MTRRRLAYVLAALVIITTTIFIKARPKSREACIEILQTEKMRFYLATAIRDSLFKSYPACTRFAFYYTGKSFMQDCDSPRDVKYLPRLLLHYKHEKELSKLCYDAELHSIYMEEHRMVYIFNGVDPFRLVQLDSNNSQYAPKRVDRHFYLYAYGDTRVWN